jgi:hypothetical protein
MTRRICLIWVVVGLLLPAALKAEDPRPLPGAIKLLPGYVHEPKQGFDSIVGTIAKKGGLEINYDIGRVPKPGGLRLGGDFVDQPKQVPKDMLDWYKEQVVQGHEVHLAYGKDKLLLASFPAHGVNFAAKAATPEDLADALLIILTFPKAEAKK